MPLSISSFGGKCIGIALITSYSPNIQPDETDALYLYMFDLICHVVGAYIVIIGVIEKRRIATTQPVT